MNSIFAAMFAGAITACTLTMPDTRPPENQANLNPGVIDIDDPSEYKAVFTISDVHGMHAQLLTDLQAGLIIDKGGHWSAGNSLLIITGDSIDKGPESLEVIELWMQLQTEAEAVNGRVVHVLGNHEAEFLADPSQSEKAKEMLKELELPKYQNLHVGDLSGTTHPFGKFFHSEALAIRVGKWLFCHSGFYPNMTWDNFAEKASTILAAGQYSDQFIIGADSILESRKWESNVDALTANLDLGKFFGVVFGHQPGAFGIKARSAALAGGRLIKIDNGMAPEGGSNPGSILKFNVPAQMNNLAYPSISVILPSGETRALTPE